MFSPVRLASVAARIRRHAWARVGGAWARSTGGPARGGASLDLWRVFLRLVTAGVDVSPSRVCWHSGARASSLPCDCRGLPS